MKEFIETIRSGLILVGELTEELLNWISLLVIIWGVFISLKRSLTERRHLTGDHPRHSYFRRMFGGWLVVALEFLLAADIIGTLIAPNTAQLIQLGAIAVIRTFLNYFLNKELNEELIVPVESEKNREHS